MLNEFDEDRSLAISIMLPGSVVTKLDLLRDLTFPDDDDTAEGEDGRLPGGEVPKSVAIFCNEEFLLSGDTGLVVNIDDDRLVFMLTTGVAGPPPEV